MRRETGEELTFSPGPCFGCSSSNPHGLGLRFFRAGNAVESRPTVDGRFDGAEGIVHGGIQATLLDETMCAAVYFNRDTYVVTGELSIRYRRPCPSRESLRVVAWIESENDRWASVAGRIEGGDGAVITEATGKFFYVDRDLTER